MTQRDQSRTILLILPFTIFVVAFLFGMSAAAQTASNSDGSMVTTMNPAALVIAPANGRLVGAKGRPILILTENGQAVVQIVGPKGATDVHVFWGNVFVPEGGGYGYWTKNGQEMPKSKFRFLGNINDIHFSSTGRVPRLPPIPAPPEANDVEISWDENDGRITEAGWTKDGQFLARIPVVGDGQEVSIQFNPQQNKTVQNPATTQLVGIVYDKNSRPGQQVTMSITTDPKKYENIPGLGVALVNVAVPHNANGQASLAGVVVDLGNGQQPADQPFTVQLPQTAGNLAVSLSNPNNQTAFGRANVPIPSLSQGVTVTAVPNTGNPVDFTTPPVIQDTSFIRGPFSSSGKVPLVTLDNQPVSILAASGTTVYFDLPTGISSGPHQLAVLDGPRGAIFPIVKMSIVGHIDQASLVRGQKTNYSVTLNIGPLPEASWQKGGGMSPELTDLAQVQTMAPGFKIPQVGGPGVVLLAINNASRDTVSIRPSNDERVIMSLHRQDFQNDQFTARGEIQSKVSGTFTLNLLGQAFFAPIGGQPLLFGLDLKKRFCPDKCPPPDPPAVPATTDVAITPKGFAAGEIDKMASGVKLVRNVPIPAAGKPIREAAAALFDATFGFAGALAKRNGVTIWVRLTCQKCETEDCYIWKRKNLVTHHSAWVKVMDLESMTKDGGETLLEGHKSPDDIAQAIKDIADTLSCP